MPTDDTTRKTVGRNANPSQRHRHLRKGQAMVDREKNRPRLQQHTLVTGETIKDKQVRSNQ